MRERGKNGRDRKRERVEREGGGKNGRKKMMAIAEREIKNEWNRQGVERKNEIEERERGGGRMERLERERTEWKK